MTAERRSVPYKIASKRTLYSVLDYYIKGGDVIFFMLGRILRACLKFEHGTHCYYCFVSKDRAHPAYYRGTLKEAIKDALSLYFQGSNTATLRRRGKLYQTYLDGTFARLDRRVLPYRFILPR